MWLLQKELVFPGLVACKTMDYIWTMDYRTMDYRKGVGSIMGVEPAGTSASELTGACSRRGVGPRSPVARKGTEGAAPSRPAKRGSLTGI